MADAANEAGGFSALEDPLNTGTAYDILVRANNFITLGGGTLSDYGIINTSL